MNKSLKIITNKNFNIENSFIPQIYTQENNEAMIIKPHTSRKNIIANICKKLNAKVYTININRILKEKINNLSLIYNHIKNLDNNINDIQRKISSCGSEINIFINNSFNPKPKFNYRKHFLILKPATIELHDRLELDNAMVKNEIFFYRFEDTELLLNLIDTPKNKKHILSASKQQIDICADIYNKFNTYNDNYAILQQDSESAIALFEYFLDDIYEIMANKNIFDINTNEKIIFTDERMYIFGVLNGNKIELFFADKNEEIKFNNKIINLELTPAVYI